MNLLKVDTIAQSREKLKAAVAEKKQAIEFVKLEDALGRVIASDLVSPEPIPHFRRSTVDGYAVRSSDTHGVTDSIPVFLEMVEKIAIGTPAVRTIGPGQCAYVPTGGMIPEGADAVVMIEYCETFDADSIAVYDSVSAGRNVVALEKIFGKKPFS